MPNFCIGFWNDIGDKKSEKKHFQVLQISVKIILVGMFLKTLNSIGNLHHLSEANRIENYGSFQAVGLKILRKSAKIKLNVLKLPPEKP